MHFSKNLEKLILEFGRFGGEEDFIGGAPPAADGDDRIGTADGSAASEQRPGQSDRSI